MAQLFSNASCFNCLGHFKNVYDDDESYVYSAIAAKDTAMRLSQDETRMPETEHGWRFGAVVASAVA